MKQTNQNENWVPIKDYEGLYEISNFGRVKSLARIVYGANGAKWNIAEKIMSQRRDSEKYLMINLCQNSKKKTFKVHVLVGRHFIENPENLPEINHIDGDKGNNHNTNLEWTDRSGNLLHAYKTGLHKSRKGCFNKKRQLAA